jgi:hypothetical protein
MTEAPIFIGGMQRSGTSLMRAIIGSHPDVAIFEWDLPLWTCFFSSFRHRDLGDPVALAELIDAIFSSEKVKACHVSVDRDAIKMCISEQPNHKITCGLVFQCFLEEYANAIGRPRWGLKTPDNELFAKDIFDAYPNAGMVQLIRDPRDVAVSYQSYGGGSWNYSGREHIAKWRRSAELARRHTERYKDRYLCVRYEDLVDDPETTTRDVCDTLGLEFNSCMLETRGQLGWNGSNSFFDDIGERSMTISTVGIGRYRTKLRPHLIYLYQKHLRANLLQYGYDLETLSFSMYQRTALNLKWSAESFTQRISTFGRALASNAAAVLQGTPIYIPVRAVYRMMYRLIADQSRSRGPK